MTTSDHGEERGLIIGGGALSIAGVLTTIVAPLLVDALGSAELATDRVGSYLTALHLAQIAVIIALGASGLVARYDRRRLGLGGCLLSSAAFVAAAVTDDASALLVLMVVVGAGAGTAYSAGGSALSFARRTERAYALVTIASIVVGAIVLIGTAIITEQHSKAGIFGGLAVILVLLGVAGTRLPALAPASTTEMPAGERPRGMSWLGVPGAALIAGYFLLNVGILAVWTFSGSIARAAGMSSSGSWWFLGLSQALSVVGCVIAWRMGDRPGKVWVLVASLLALMLGKFMIGTADLVPYAIGMLVTNLTFYTAIPFVFAAGADLNPRSGRLVVVVGASAMAAGAVAPLVGGLAAGAGDDWMRLGVVAALLIAAAIPLLLYAQRAAGREALTTSSREQMAAP